ncbi:MULTISPECIES: hypothetical protein [unclassified Microbacterium]|uniref:hypothetical protein n=1 Tax=unclassified Microbacterium TaxID=2609290 RepID=UPI00214B18BC|nr:MULTISPECIES: hypothetical protein [unclassified Microbacterium]MCR2784505.1 hypothetical protein [Microbacterium sp. zg.B96]WIM14683.1 hypothetical protein QNO11_08885 [Microbacterium sp. zg-B96]
MADKVHRIHTLPEDAPWTGGLPPVGSDEHPRMVRVLDRVLAVQRPVVVAHLRSIRLRHPDATNAQIVRMLERRYLAAVTTGGAAVGATAVVPGIGTGVTLALSGVETVGFLDATALFAQSMSELHGIPVDNPDRARALVLTLMLGKEGVDLVSQLAGQVAGKGVTRDKYWGEMITKTLPRAAVGPLVDRLKTSFVHQFAAKGGASVVGKAMPFGIGAAIGGTGNHILGRRVLVNARRGFGVPPEQYPPALEPKEGAARLEHAAVRGVRRAGDAVAHAGIGAAHGVQRAAKRVGGAVRPRRRRAITSTTSDAEAHDAATPDDLGDD